MREENRRKQKKTDAGRNAGRKIVFLAYLLKMNYNRIYACDSQARIP